MNNRIFVSLLLGVLPLTMMAQDDDMYFVPSKKSHERVAPHRDAPRPRPTYYSGSNRSVDEYNRRGFGSSYQVVSADTTGNDIILFSGERGVYPDSTMTEDFSLTRQMALYDGYDIDAAYRDGYRDGTSDSWHSPWFYSSYYPWYDSSYWYWNDPWYYRHYGWYYSWYDPWYYDYYWYRPYYYRPYYYGGGYWHGGSGRGSLYARNGNTGTIDRSGSSHGRFTGGQRTLSTASSRATATQRATYNSNAVRSNSGNFSRTTSNSGNFNRSTTTTSSSGNFNRSSSSSSGSFSRSSSGGSFGSSSGGGSRGGGSIGRAGRR